MSEPKLPQDGKQALKMFLEADFDRDGVAEVNGITLLQDGDVVEFVDYSESLDEPESVTYKLFMKVLK